MVPSIVTWSMEGRLVGLTIVKRLLERGLLDVTIVMLSLERGVEAASLARPSRWSARCPPNIILPRFEKDRPVIKSSSRRLSVGMETERGEKMTGSASSVSSASASSMGNDDGDAAGCSCGCGCDCGCDGVVGGDCVCERGPDSLGDLGEKGLRFQKVVTELGDFLRLGLAGGDGDTGDGGRNCRVLLLALVSGFIP